jgi:tetratricopeptide (TPR) repeat protein
MRIWGLIGILLGGSWAAGAQTGREASSRPQAVFNVAVADFRYQGPEGKEWLALGVADMLRQYLSHLSAFRVVDGLDWREATVSHHLPSQAWDLKDLQTLGETFHVEYVVRGEVAVREGEVSFTVKAQIVHLPRGKAWREHKRSLSLAEFFNGVYLLMNQLLDEWGARLSREDRARLVAYIPTRSLLAFEFYCKGLERYDPNAPHTALQIWQRALEFDSECALIHAALGRAAYRRAQQLMKLAETSFQRALASDPHNADLHFALGVAYQSRGRTDLAEMEYLAALKGNPNHLEAHYNLGVLYLRARRYNNAVTQFQEVLRIVPNHVNAMNNLGVAYYHLGRRNEAIGLWRAVLRVDPANGLAKENLERYSEF